MKISNEDDDYDAEDVDETDNQSKSSVDNEKQHQEQSCTNAAPNLPNSAIVDWTSTDPGVSVLFDRPLGASVTPRRPYDLLFLLSFS